MPDTVGARGFEILPSIDLRGRRVVRLRQGDFGQETAYDLDPEEVASAFVKAGARLLHVVDLDGARSGIRANADVVEAIVRAVGQRGLVEVAGGIRDQTTAANMLALGAQRVVLGTAVLAEASLAERLVAAHGADRVVAAIDVRDGLAVGQGWVARAVRLDAVTLLRRLSDKGIAIFEVTAIDRDGLLQGPDVDLYERLVGLHEGEVIASGGIASLDDLRAVRWDARLVVEERGQV
jgi:phosphoribosylformimino-5-aminoimidazole carboxamide ribotide isomerase